jgi:ectoine hydroxylase-related dioxygenase (phytanoyl-CoA dioxygenase family)
MLNCLIMVDDFTVENGGTFLVPGSHLEERKPTEQELFLQLFKQLVIKEIY